VSLICISSPPTSFLKPTEPVVVVVVDVVVVVVVDVVAVVASATV